MTLTCVGDDARDMQLLCEDMLLLECPSPLTPPEDAEDSEDNMETLSEKAESLSGLSVRRFRSLFWLRRKSSQSMST